MLCDMTPPDSLTRMTATPSWLVGLFALLVAALLSIQSGHTEDTTEEETPGQLSVVELFSSQACGACPPAVELLQEIAQRPDVLALSWSVNYFDHDSWQDTLAKPAFGARQRRYNIQHGIPGVRTPQMVIGGQVDIVGAKPDEVKAALARAGIKSRPIHVKHTAEGISFDLPASDTIRRGTVTLVHFWDEVSVDIAAGENQGKTMTYRHAVMDIKPIGIWDGSVQHFSLSAADLCDHGNALLVQDEDSGAIIFAALIRRP